MLVPYCLVVRIPGSHPGGPGSIPGMGKISFGISTNVQLISFLKNGRHGHGTDLELADNLQISLLIFQDNSKSNT